MKVIYDLSADVEVSPEDAEVFDLVNRHSAMVNRHAVSLNKMVVAETRNGLVLRRKPIKAVQFLFRFLACIACGLVGLSVLSLLVVFLFVLVMPQRFPVLVSLGVWSVFLVLIVSSIMPNKWR